MKDYSFGNYICKLRERRGLSQFQLGALVGVTDKAVSKWENGDAKPRISTFYRLADVLDVSVDELLSCEKMITPSARKELEKLNKRLWRSAYEKLSATYAGKPPVVCWSRLAAEEAALADTNAIQVIAVVGAIVKEAHEQGSVIFAAGTFNSSYAAWLFGATSVNPLEAHYYCPYCGNVEFVADVSDGFDLEPKRCPCGHAFKRDGHNIPFEGYAKGERALGSYVEVRLSERMKLVAAKVINDFYQGKAEILPIKIQESEPEWCMEKYVVLPPQKKRPTLNEDGFWHTDSETYWNWHEEEISFSLITHSKLEELDKLQERTHAILPSLDMLVTKENVVSLCQEKCQQDKPHIFNTEPSSFSMLVHIEAASHASFDLEALENIAETGSLDLSQLPTCREDIWYMVNGRLKEKGIHWNGLALQVMENTRKGRYYAKGIPAGVERMLLELGITTEYIASLRKTLYLFPKGHIIAVLLLSLMEQWYRQNYPEAFVCCSSKRT